jgi:hypothetical protein
MTLELSLYFLSPCFLPLQIKQSSTHKTNKAIKKKFISYNPKLNCIFAYVKRMKEKAAKVVWVQSRKLYE